MTNNYFLANCIEIYEPRLCVNGRVAECKACGASMTIPDSFGEHLTEANMAHFFRVLTHSKKCPAMFAYKQDKEFAEKLLEKAGM